MPEPPPPSPPPPALSWRDRLAVVRASLPGVPAPMAAGGAAVAAVAVVVVVVAAFVRSPSPRPQLVLPRAAPAAPGPTAAGGAPAPAETRVHVAGAVVRPGVYRVAEGGRVADVLDAAGGPLAEADVDQVNLAARVADGERVYVPRRGEVPPAVVTGGPGTGPAGPAPPVDLNVATAAQLDALPGIGPATAAAIVEYRTRHGRFVTVDELVEVRGIGEAKLAALRPRVRV